MWAACRHPRASLVWISRRAFTIHNLNKSIQKTAMLEDIAYCDYTILRKSRFGPITEELHPYLIKITSLADFVRNVKNSYNSNSKVRTYTKSKKRKLESIFSMFLHSLHFACLGSKKVPKRFRRIMREIPEDIKYNISLSPHELLDQAQKFDKNFEKNVHKLITLYLYGDTDLMIDRNRIGPEALEIVKVSYAALLSQLGDKYNCRHIMKWISSLMAHNVSDCCHSLIAESEFPGFIIKNLLLRAPTSEYEFDLMFEFYNKYIKSTSIVPEIIVQNLVRSANRYKFEKLDDIVKILLTKISAVSDEYLENIVCLMADLEESKNTRDHYLHILSSQRLLVDAILGRKGKMTPLGYLGIAHGLLPLSTARANKFLEFATDQGFSSPREENLASIVRLKLSQSPEALIHNFDQTMGDLKLSKDTRIWKELLLSLEKFDLLNEDNSKGFAKRLQGRQYGEAKTELLPHQPLDQLLEGEPTLNNKSLGIILKKLYKTNEPLPIFGTGFNYARQIFNHISSPSRSIVGTVLLGESFHNPQEAYNLYKRLLEAHCDNEPNERCVISLIIPAYTDRTLRWDNRLASQIAVHEFRKHCKRSIDDIEGSFIPSNSLWKPYIKLLGRYNYQDELSEIMKLWGDLKITPERETLAMLLASLPEGMGESKIKHASKYLVTDRDPQELEGILEEPQWEWPEDYELKYWRGRILKKR